LVSWISEFRSEFIHSFKKQFVLLTMRSLCIIALLCLAASSALASPSTNKVLILQTTISEGIAIPGGSYESAAVLAAGLIPDVVSSTTWSTMTAAQFGSYRAIILGDASCTNLASYAAAMANANVWIPQIAGSMIIMGTDPVSKYTAHFCCNSLMMIVFVLGISHAVYESRD